MREKEICCKHIVQGEMVFAASTLCKGGNVFCRKHAAYAELIHINAFHQPGVCQKRRPIRAQKRSRNQLLFFVLIADLRTSAKSV